MKTVLITGSAGFVGHHLVEHLLEKTDWNLVGIDSFRHRGDSLRVHPSGRYRIFCHDLAAPVSTRLMEKIGSVDYLINMASESHVDRSITDPVPFVENNIKLTLNILEYARAMKPDVFIQISTDEVYGAAPEGTDHAEWSPIIPSNPYSASKAAQEALAISYWRTYQVPLIITNTMNMFGERQDTEKYIPMLISKIQKGEPVTVHGNQKYIGKRHYLHARNHADALLFLIQNVQPSLHEDGDFVTMPQRFNIVGDMELDNLQLAKEVADILDKNLSYSLVDFHSARPGHDRRYSLDGTKIRSYGWRAPIEFHESLQRTVEWTVKNSEWLK